MKDLTNGEVFQLCAPVDPKNGNPNPYFIEHTQEVKNYSIQLAVEEAIEMLQKKNKSIGKVILKDHPDGLFNSKDPKIIQLFNESARLKLPQVNITDEQMEEIKPNRHTLQCLRLIRKEPPKPADKKA